MSPELRRAIEWDVTRLIHEYVSLNDQQRWEELAGLYTEDGQMIRPSSPGEPIVGRTAILASFRARPQDRATSHICSTVLVSAHSDTTASALSTYLIYAGVRSGPGLPVLEGRPPSICRFEDQLLRTADGWRFTLRRGSNLFRTT